MDASMSLDPTWKSLLQFHSGIKTLSLKAPHIRSLTEFLFFWHSMLVFLACPMSYDRIVWVIKKKKKELKVTSEKFSFFSFGRSLFGQNKSLKEAIFHTPACGWVVPIGLHVKHALAWRDAQTNAWSQLKSLKKILRKVSTSLSNNGCLVSPSALTVAQDLDLDRTHAGSITSESTTPLVVLM